MDHVNPREERFLKVELLRRLLGDNRVLPNDIRVDEVREWFCHRESGTAFELVEELVDDTECPLEWTPGSRNEVWLLSREETEDYIEELEDTPWYEL